MYHMPSDAIISMRLPREVVEAAERAAEAEDRTRSSWCLHVLREKLIAEGYLTAPARKGSKPSRKAG
jgi:hypothetical protein